MMARNRIFPTTSLLQESESTNVKQDFCLVTFLPHFSGDSFSFIRIWLCLIFCLTATGNEWAWYCKIKVCKIDAIKWSQRQAPWCDFYDDSNI